ncbi:histone-lysine N-methyltransferase ASHH1-like [Solanum stenotomum]|uniref:histone-lysine N-methyltransferase ASHH1-like n=1 Tax=Solanum stenotomum TaxID=172797 RepID=UPI0020D13662|nr:histone-lysine N-methyltransferase ASHH1-like [Solanum stenotomum]
MADPGWNCQLLLDRFEEEYRRNIFQVQLPEGVTPFIHITQNEFIWRKHKKPREEDIAICECKYDASDPNSACVGRCLNLLTNIECTPGYCLCGDTCRIQRFEKCEFAKTKLFRTEGRGWGLLAVENVKAGQFIIECCGEVSQLISYEEVKKRSQAYESHDLKDVYIISVDGNDFIDSTRKGSLARFINHSCSPNCETSKWIVSGETRVGIFANQDISVGMELTYEYNFEWYYGGANVRCLCGAANCSLFLGAKCRRFREYNHVWEDGDDRYIVDDLPVYDSTDNKSTLVISGTSGGNEHTKILNDGEGSTFKLEPTNSAAKKSQRKPKLKRLNTAYLGWKYGKRASETNKAAVECNFCKKVTNGGIFRHKQHLIGTCRDVSRCEQCPDVVREEMKKYVDVKKEQKRQALLQKDVTNNSDDKDEDMEEGEATE